MGSKRPGRHPIDTEGQTPPPAAPRRAPERAGPDAATVEALVGRIWGLSRRVPRLRIGIAGPPGAGKSTLAAALVERLNRERPEAALVPMDGFHLDNAVLRARGLERRKGAPETFDADGFVNMVRRLGSEQQVVVPIFDRERDIAVAGAQVIGPDVRIAVVEGNYLLLREAPWYGLHGLWDLSVFVAPDGDELQDRLIRRWTDLGQDYAEARRRVRLNDLPNARLVLTRQARADIEL